jgi:pre-rRNA-processing protein TSR3
MCDVIIRHPKERKSKCSLQPLRNREDLCFLTASDSLRFDATGYILLAVGAPPLDTSVSSLPILLLDSTWRLLPRLERCIHGVPVRRSLPASLRTAYPRKSKLGADPETGLASVEALYAARRILQRSTHGLLDQYHWKEAFLAQF